MKLNKKLERFLNVHKPIKVIYGGRDSGKSIAVGDIMTMKMETEGTDILCLREFQESLTDSVHKVFKASIQERLELENWEVLDADDWEVFENKILSPAGFRTVYKGASRNPENIKSAAGFKYSWFEEAQKMSQDSVDILPPTIIRTPGAECWFTANPFRSTDPFSKRFLLPFIKHLNKYGFYEDELHMIIKMNWRDNPWYDENTEILRKWDYENLPRAKYCWIWEGDFYDGIEDALILPEWFDACIDAHERLGFEPIGISMSSHDPADSGDAKGFAHRHGSVVQDVQELFEGDVNDGCDWACGLAIAHNADAFTWDCDGLGLALKKQVARAFAGKSTKIAQYKGSEGVDFPNMIYEPVGQNPNDTVRIQDQKTNKQTFKNKRAQYYADLRDKIHRTFEAVIKKKYHDPDKMISFSSKILAMTQLRSELCSMPIKPNRNGLFELYTKEDMKRLFKLPSPNLADSVKMLGRVPRETLTAGNVQMPKSMRPMGKTTQNRRGKYGY